MIENSHHILPQTVLADWFERSLVIVQDDCSPNSTIPSINNAISETVAIQYWGHNEKQIAILLKDKSADYLSEEVLQFLTNILKACSLTLNDIAIVNIYQQKNINYNQLKEKLSINTCVSFGITPAEIDIFSSFSLFEVGIYDNISFVFAPELMEMNANTSESKILKAKLWKSLQKLFNIN